jgi:signal transduction histidine kinase
LKDRALALWGVPLRSKEKVIGVLVIGFSKPLDWLPTERNLLRAIADRSALAIDRAGMTDALREREMRIAELSGHLMHAQEEERKRISRELHDETGQALMVIRLYLGMLETTVSARGGKAKIRETLDVVDRTIEGIRRIIARLSPLVLQELGLIAAVRKEAKDLAKSAGVKAKVSVSPEFGRLPAAVEAAFYRVVQEALHNVAKHANATTVNIEMKRDGDLVRLTIDDDGVGITPKPTNGRQTFGMAGMRERIGNIGGKVKVSSARGQGTRIEVNAPVSGNGVAAGKEVTRGSAGVVAQGA